MEFGAYSLVIADVCEAYFQPFTEKNPIYLSVKQ